MSTDLPSPADPDFEQRCRTGFSRQPVMTTLGARLTSVRPGACEIEMPFDARMTQQHGSLHAGVIATLADNAGAYAALSLSPPGTDIVAVEFKINFLAPGRGDRFVACGRVLRGGRTLSVAEIDVFAETGTDRVLIARMQQTTMRVAE